MKRLLSAVQNPPSIAAQRGVTLVELMVAITIGLVILVALGQLFVTSRSSYAVSEGAARTQEAGRFAMDFLAYDIRMAGYAGCHNPSSAGAVSGTGVNTTCSTSFCNLADNPNEATRFFAEGVRGYSYIGSGSNALGDWNPTLPSTFFTNGDVAPYTDVILLQYAQPSGIKIAGNPPDNANKKVPYPSVPLLDGVTTNDEIAENDILVLSDCKSTDVFRVTNISGGGGDRTIVHAATGNHSSHLSHSYADGAEILRLITRVYYISPANAGGEPALMRRERPPLTNPVTTHELVQGVESMRIMYGVDTDPPNTANESGIANRYAQAKDVGVSVGTSWDDVVNLRLGLLIRTPNSKVDQELDTNTYELVDGVTVGPLNDNRRRQLYRSTIQLRN